MNIENIYREIIEKLEREHLGRYTKPYSNTKFFIKEEQFTEEEAIKLCVPIITNRIESELTQRK